MWAFWNADTFVALTLSKTLGDDGIKLNLSLQLSDAKALVVLVLESLLALVGAKSQRSANKNSPLLPSAMTDLRTGSE